MLEKEFKYYLANQDELVKQYNGKFIVIVDEQVTGAYDSNVQAYTEASKKYPAGSFLIQKCSPGIQDYTQTFYSRVSFS
jgi:hypothetical protein